MFKLLWFIALVAYVAAKPLSSGELIEIVKSVQEIDEGSYNFAYEASNGIKAEEHGTIQATGKEDEANKLVEGSYEFDTPDGEHVAVKYTADENGFHPDSAAIPVGPPTPDYILRALDYIEKHPYTEPK